MKIIFFRFAKTLLNRGFSKFGFFVAAREEIGKTMITEIYEFCFFGPKMAVL